MKHTIKHDLGPDLAHKVMNKAFESYAARFSQYSPTLRWQGPRSCLIGLTAMGKSITAVAQLEPGQITVEMNVPFFLRPFKGQAIKIIDEEVRSWIGRAKSGQI